MSPVARFKRLIYAVFDQALLSLSGLLVSLFLIRFASKDHYGVYLLVMSIIYLVQGLQNSLILSPYVTRVSSGLTGLVSVAKLLVQIGNFLLVLAVAVVAVLFLTYTDDGRASVFDFDLLFAFVVAVSGWLVRESVRSYLYVEGGRARVLFLNSMYVFSLILYMAFSWYFGGVSLQGLFLAMGIGGLLSLSMMRLPSIGLDGMCREGRAFLDIGRWAIVGVILSWFNSNFYPFFLESRFGLELVSEVGAARLFVMPFLMVVPAWSNHYRARLGEWFSAGDSEAMRKATLRSLFVFLMISIIWGGISVGVVRNFPKLTLLYKYNA